MDWSYRFLILLLFGATTLGHISRVGALKFQIRIGNLSKPTYCHGEFLSLADGLKKSIAKALNPSNRKLHNLAAALSPACLRLGGTRSNFLTFDPNESRRVGRGVNPNWQNFTLTGKQWESINNFSNGVGWDLIFDFNALNKRLANGSWDPSNAELFLDYSQRKDIDIPAFQLGNEPNSNNAKHGKSYSATRAVSDMRLLRATLDKFPKYRASKIIGPEVTSISRHKGSYNYMKAFLEAGGNKIVDFISWHHYYIDGRTATPEQFLDPNVLDGMKTELEVAQSLFKKFQPVLPMVLSETSSAFGGGAPNLSNRYAAGFMWLDKLGLSAQAGVRSLFRQTFDMGSYGMVDGKTFEPFPDYFLSLLFKRLVLGPVLKGTIKPKTDKLRVYVHCARLDYYSYPKGAIVLYYLNLQNSAVTLSLHKYKKKTLDLYQLTPGDVDGLRSRFVNLNGKTLKMQGNNLPPLTAKRHRGDVTVEPQSFGYIVVTNAMESECL